MNTIRFGFCFGFVSMFVAVVVVVSCIVFVTPNQTRADDWPNWLGPERTGVTSETNWRHNWQVKPPKEVWRSKVGVGFSSTAISGGKLYTLGHAGGNETVFCLDANTGKEIWKHVYPCALINRFYEGGSSSTPTIDTSSDVSGAAGGKMLYTLGKQGQLFCFDAGTGDIKWQHDLRKLLGSKVPEWGYACSPVILGDELIIQAGVVAGFDKKTGKLKWQSERYKQAYGSPTVFTFKGKTLLAVLNNDGLLVADASDGKTLATTRWKTSFGTNSTTPMVVDDTIFISTGYFKGCAKYKFTGSALEPIYVNKNMANHMNNTMLVEGHLYGFNGNGHGRGRATFDCINFKTGEKTWKQEGLGCGALTACIDGRLLVMSDKGDLVVVKASPKGYDELARAKRVVKGRVWTVPVLANGKIYCRSSPGDLVCLDVSK